MGSCKKIKEVVIRSYHLRAKVAAKLEKCTKNAEVLGQLVFIASERASQHSPRPKVLEDLGAIWCLQVLWREVRLRGITIIGHSFLTCRTK